MTLRNSSLAEYYYRAAGKILLARVAKLPLTPNHFTLLGLIVAMLVPLGFWMHPVFGLIFMTVSGGADTLDGWFARQHGTSSKSGAFLDSTADRISDVLYLFGFWILFWDQDGVLLSGSLMFIGVLFTLMISYVKARAEALGGACNVGWMERGWRTLFLILWAFLLCALASSRNRVLWAGLVLYLLLTGTTVVQRIRFARRSLAEQNRS
jgi:phosphatidylglycerophosphate synthase